MTGFGAAEVSLGQGRLRCELRSLNQRALEVRVRAPPELMGLEGVATDVLRTQVRREHVDVALTTVDPAGAPARSDRARALDFLLGELEAWAAQHPNVIQDIRLGDILIAQALQTSAPAPPGVRPPEDVARLLIHEAAEALVVSRDQEGAQLHVALAQQLDALSALTDDAHQRSQTIVPRLRAALTRRLAEAAVRAPDENRLAQEIAMLAERADITEEIDRLRAHTARFRTYLDDDGPVGRRLDFLCQELLREANTVASKAQDADLSHVAVEMKVVVDRLREQVQNVE